MTIDEMITVLRAAKEGKVIEAKSKMHDQWKEYVGSHCFVPDFQTYDYRVKPEPREWWLLDEGDYALGCRTPDETNTRYKIRTMDRNLIHVREVLP